MRLSTGNKSIDSKTLQMTFSNESWMPSYPYSGIIMYAPYIYTRTWNKFESELVQWTLETRISPPDFLKQIQNRLYSVRCDLMN